MKTVFITVSRGSIAKNLFHTGIVKNLLQKSIRVVLLTPAFQDAEFISTFAAPNLYFEDLPAARFNVIDRILVAFARGIIYNRTTRQIDRYGLYNNRETNFVKYLVKALFFKPLSHFPILRDALRWLDLHLATNNALAPFFEKWQPDLIFSTNISESDDADVVKIARKRGVKIVALPKSWDNLSKSSFRAKADLLLVWSEYMKEEAKRFQNYKDNDIVVVGVPHFDIYTQEDKLLKRDIFFNLIGADSTKKLIFFGSEGKVSHSDGEIARLIYEMIRNNELVYPAQLFIRPYLAYPQDEKKFEPLRGLADVIIDKSFVPNEVFYDHWDYSFQQYKFMASAMHYLDVMITSMSTLTLDASFNKKPVINIAFDGYTKKPYRDSMIRWYDSEHYVPVVRSGVATMVRSREELRNAINAYLSNPARHEKEREEFVRYLCDSRNGKSAELVSSILIKELSV